MSDIRSDSTTIPVFCQYCGKRIIHDGKHWAEQPTYTVLNTEVDVINRLRTCPKSPIMVKFHVPEPVGEEKQRTHCIPEVNHD